MPLLLLTVSGLFATVAIGITPFVLCNIGLKKATGQKKRKQYE